MEINRNGNVLTNSYFAGIVLGDNAASKWAAVSFTYSALAGDKIQADTSGAAFTITLPATASIGDTILIQDAKLTWNTHNLTLGCRCPGGTGNGRYPSILTTWSATCLPGRWFALAKPHSSSRPSTFFGLISACSRKYF